MKYYKTIKIDIKEGKIISCKNDISHSQRRFFAMNSEYLALPNNSNSEIAIVDSSNPLNKRLENQIILNPGYGNFSDLTFSPFSNNILATSYENCKITLWNINKNKAKQDFSIYNKHRDNVCYLSFNPRFPNIISSVSFKGEFHIWNILKNEPYIELYYGNNPTSLEWNKSGALIGLTEGNGINIVDGRQKKEAFKFTISETSDNSNKFSWIGDEEFVSTGTNNNGEQKLKLWDIRKLEKINSGGNEIQNINLGKSKLELIPFTNKELKIIYTIRRKDNVINIYNYSVGNLTKITDFTLSEYSLFSFYRENLDFIRDEIDRFVTYTSNKNIYYTNFLIHKEEKDTSQSLNSFSSNIYDKRAIKNEDIIPEKDDGKSKNEVDLISLKKQQKKDSNIYNDYKEEVLRLNLKIYKEFKDLKSQLVQNQENEILKTCHDEDEFDKIMKETIVIKKEEQKEEKEEEKKENFYDLFIINTEPLCEGSKTFEDLIENEKIIGRKFINNNNISYYELFENRKLNLINQVSKKISFLHPPKDNTYDSSKIIGFRYYKYGVKIIKEFFTIINKYDQKYFILEKKEDSKFYNKELNCFDIIKTILEDKYKNLFFYGESFPELIGFSYSLLYIKIKGFSFIEPFMPNYEMPESLIEAIPDQLNNNITYIEPIIYDSHISILFFKLIENKRINILIDISRYHSKENLDQNIFPLAMRKDLKIFPKLSIQMYNSCALWFYGQVELILTSNRYNTISDVYFNINKKIVYYLDVINLISTKYQKTSIIDLNEINVPNKIFFYFFSYMLVLDKNLIYNIILDFDSFLKLIYFSHGSYDGIKFIIDCQNIIKEYREFRCLLNLNNNYLKFSNKNWNCDLETIIAQCSNFMKNFEYKYSTIFDEISEMFIQSLLKHGGQEIQEQIKKIHKKEVVITRAINYDIVNELKEQLQEIKSNFNCFKLYDQDSILSFIYSSKNIIFSTMNK